MIALKWFMGLNKTPKVMMSLLIVPIIVLVLIVILEKLFKWVLYLWIKLSDTISYIFNKDNRSIYVVTSIIMFAVGLYVERKYNVVVEVEDLWSYVVDRYSYIVDYISS